MLQRLAQRFLTPLLDFIYPPRCLHCGGAIRVEDVLCAACLADAIALPMDEAASRENLGSLTFHAPAAMMYVGFEFEHEGAIEACLHAMKYQGMRRIAVWFGRMLGERVVDTGMATGPPLLVPVPLHTVKRIERGFNQAEKLCLGVAKETGWELLPRALRRTRYTESQAASRLRESERRGNVLNAFVVDPGCADRIRGRPVVLVDDVITTGATIGECAAVLLENGAAEVRLLAVARPEKDAG